ncbi:MAG: carbohydrate ABC transporter permease [Clostridiales bacterium]|nr:carbohydrate ABC transporter permease [Clostridiales bacterium]
MEAVIEIKRRKKIKVSTIVAAIITIVFVLIFLFPIVLAILTSFKTPLETAESILSLPKQINFNNYIEGMKRSNFFRAMINSCITTFPSVALIVICASMGGYTIARNSAVSRIVKSMDTVYLASLMIPFQILMIPLYKIYKTLQLQNSLFGMILVLTGTSIAYSTFLYVGFAKSIPKELEEAALIDGCGPYRAFIKIVFPLLKPITATVSALHIMWLWNDFNMALIILQKEEMRTLTVKQYYFFGEHTADYGMAFAASIVSMLPILLFFIAMQKHLVEGISAGAVKA